MINTRLKPVTTGLIGAVGLGIGLLVVSSKPLQAATVVIRALSLGEVTDDEWLKILFKEKMGLKIIFLQKHKDFFCFVSQFLILFI